jgi:ADP-ribosyl-[dinitrogen reductase] hydrolase
VGGALGDALGYPIEFLSRSQIKTRHGVDGLCDLMIDPATGFAKISDDTQMTLFTASGLLNASYRIRDRGIGTIVNSGVYPAYLRWLYTQTGKIMRPAYLKPTRYEREGIIPAILEQRELFASRAPGNTCLSALETGVIGTLEAPLNDSKGCGGVMRVAPVGLLYLNKPYSAFWKGVEIAAITHGHPTGCYPAGVLATLISILASGASIQTALSEAHRQLLAAGNYDEEEVACLGYANVLGAPKNFGRGIEETYFAIALAIQLAEENTISPEQAINRIGEGWVAEEALAIALYCVLREADIKKALLLSVNHDGDSDSTGAICGNLLGAIYGLKALPPEWTEKIELHDFIIRIADCMCTCVKP